MTAENRARSNHIKAAKIYGHTRKGVGKRNASKTRRKVGKAIIAAARQVG